MSRILVVEDSSRIATFVEKGLRSAGYVTVRADDGETGLMLARTGDFDLVVLDVGLPRLDGFTVLHRLRDEGVTTPVILLTARDSAQDCVAGLEGGADDYVTKPFHFAEFLARVRLRLRDDPPPQAGGVLREGDLALDLRSRRADSGGRTVDLTAREFALLETFMRHRGQVLSREQLLGQVWGYDHDPGSNVVDVYVRALRNKVGAQRIETVRGMGYRLL
ncbi:MAG: response regulator transcription factor [Dermatophilaceae bacterium]